MDSEEELHFQADASVRTGIQLCIVCFENPVMSAGTNGPAQWRKMPSNSSLEESISNPSEDGSPKDTEKKHSSNPGRGNQGARQAWECCRNCYMGLYRDVKRVVSKVEVEPALFQQLGNNTIPLDVFKEVARRVGESCLHAATNAGQTCPMQPPRTPSDSDEPTTFKRCSRCRTQIVIQKMPRLTERLLVKAFRHLKKDTRGTVRHGKAAFPKSSAARSKAMQNSNMPPKKKDSAVEHVANPDREGGEGDSSAIPNRFYPDPQLQPALSASLPTQKSSSAAVQIMPSTRAPLRYDSFPAMPSDPSAWTSAAQWSNAASVPAYHAPQYVPWPPHGMMSMGLGNYWEQPQQPWLHQAALQHGEGQHVAAYYSASPHQIYQWPGQQLTMPMHAARILQGSHVRP